MALGGPVEDGEPGAGALRDPAPEAEAEAVGTAVTALVAVALAAAVWVPVGAKAVAVAVRGELPEEEPVASAEAEGVLEGTAETLAVGDAEADG